MKKFYPIRLIVFLVATISLAKFFEAGRLIANEKTFTHLSLSILSFLVFAFALFVLGYWVYKEEKEKNNLRIKFKPYEWLSNVIARSEATKQSSIVKGLLRSPRSAGRLRRTSPQAGGAGRLFEPPRNDTEGVR